MKEVFIVYGSTGEYSDRSEWAAAVVETEDDAKAYVTALEQQYQRIPRKLHENRYRHEDKMKAIMTLDPEFSADYTGTSYFYGRAQFVPSSAIAAKLAA